MPTANDHGSGLTLTSVGQPPAGQGTVGIVGGHAVYTPPPGFTGTVTVPYTTTDGAGGTSDSTITITVVPPGPVAADDSGTVQRRLDADRRGSRADDERQRDEPDRDRTHEPGARLGHRQPRRFLLLHARYPASPGPDTFHYTVDRQPGPPETARTGFRSHRRPPPPIDGHRGRAGRLYAADRVRRRITVPYGVTDSDGNPTGSRSRSSSTPLHLSHSRIRVRRRSGHHCSSRLRECCRTTTETRSR